MTRGREGALHEREPHRVLRRLWWALVLASVIHERKRGPPQEAGSHPSRQFVGPGRTVGPHDDPGCGRVHSLTRLSFARLTETHEPTWPTLH